MVIFNSYVKLPEGKSAMFPLCHYISPIYLPYNIIPGVLGALKSAKFTEVNDTSRVEQVKPMYWL